MIIYRIGKTRWGKDLSGEGARLNGGRWNNIGVPCLYTAASRALALLEYSAHTPLDLIPRALCFTAYKIPDYKIFECREALLPGNWKQISHSQECKDFGSSLLNNHLVIRLPSVILPYEFNYVLNPANAEFQKLISLEEVLDYSYDLRIKIS